MTTGMVICEIAKGLYDELSPLIPSLAFLLREEGNKRYSLQILVDVA